MAASVVYAGVFGAVLASMRSLKTSLVVFDTAVVDLTEALDDPVDVLFGTQLGGGTDINRAIAYCQGLIARPHDTVFVLISDLYEGGIRDEMLKRIATMTAAGVQTVVLLALSDEGAPSYDHDNAAALADLGVPAFACTPDLFPELMAAAVQRHDLRSCGSVLRPVFRRPACGTVRVRKERAMDSIRRIRRLSVVMALGALVVGLAVVPASGAAASGGHGNELAGVRATPDIPVRGHASAQPQRPARCDKDIDTAALRGLAFVAAQDNEICTSADIDSYSAGSGTYVVQAGGEEAAFIATDVTNPASPIRYGPFTWARRGAKGTYTPDVKAFSQTVEGVPRQYIALSLERLRVNGFCGVVVFDVTDPATPVFETQIYKNTPSDFWCDVHNSFVETLGGDGRYLYLTADARNDMRVVDIADVANLPATCDIATNCAAKEVGIYKAPTAVNADNYVHDVTVIDHGGTTGRRVYVSYWDTGLVILNAADVTPGTTPTPIATIDPPGFLTHHAFASADGSLVFLQDEILDQPGDAPVRMWTLGTSPPTEVDALALGADVPANPAHNLEIRFDLAPNRLYVAWYKLGLQAWDFTGSGFDRAAGVPGRTAVQYHQVQTEAGDDPYDGAWGVRMADIGSCRYFFQSDRRYGLIIDKDGSCA